MNKKIVYGDKAREALVKGVDAVADVVKVTLGPKGKNVIVDKEYGDPQIINDGVSIAKEVELEDPAENAGARLVISAAMKANEVAGDGTTTSVVLTQAIIKEGLKNLSAGRNSVSMKNGMNFAARDVIDMLESQAVSVNTDEAIVNVASISAGNDTEVGKLIAEAMEKVGKDGIITVSESKTFDTSLEVVEGMQFDRGYISQYFVTDTEKMEASFDNPYVLCVNKRLGGAQELMPILEQIARDGSPVVIIAEDIEGEALATLTMNNLRKLIKVIAIKAPDFGINRKDKLEDIAILTGGKCVIDELGVKLENFTLNDLGRAEKVIATKDHTTIIVSQTNEKLEEHIKLLKAKIEVAENTFEQDKLKERLAKLAGGVAVIKVGALTEVEMHEKKLRIEDALNATRAAVVEGVVAGGGSALLNCYKQMKVPTGERIDADFSLGYEIVLNSLTAPVIQIAENAGLCGKAILSDILKLGEKDIGYDAISGEYVNMFKKGIIDPVRVTKSAILNAVSVSSMILTTEASITKLPEKENSLKLQNII